MHVNGPTWSVQPLPKALSGYYNIAPQSVVKTSNSSDNTSAVYLTDGMISFQSDDLAKDFEAKDGLTTIEMEWDSFRTVRGFLVYNALEYANTFQEIEKVEMVSKTLSGEALTVTIERLAFDWDWHKEAEREFVRPGGAAVAEFDEIPVKKIVFYIRAREGASALGIGEIFVMGSDHECKSVTEFAEYRYLPREYGEGKYRNEGKFFGSVETSDGTFDTSFGFKERQDGADRFVEQTAPGEQYAYVKGTVATSLYFEVDVRITADHALPLESGNGVFPQGDPSPKFGLVLQYECDGKKNTVFFFVDGGTDYTGTQVGCALVNDNGWQQEQRTTVDGLSYKNGDTVRLALARKEEQFVFLCNGEVVMRASNFDGFAVEQACVVGLCCYSTPAYFSGYRVENDGEVLEKMWQSWQESI